jgi:hypothetical protein
MFYIDTKVTIWDRMVFESEEQMLQAKAMLESGELKTGLERLIPEKQWEVKGAMAENMNKALKFRAFNSPYNLI